MLASALALHVAAAQAAPPPRGEPEHRADTAEPARTGTNAPMHTPTTKTAPDTALLEYLGEFDEAADGLDAMGLDEAAAAQRAANAGHQEHR